MFKPKLWSWNLQSQCFLKRIWCVWGNNLFPHQQMLYCMKMLLLLCLLLFIKLVPIQICKILNSDKSTYQICLPFFSDKIIIWCVGLKRELLYLLVGLAMELMSTLPKISLVVWVCRLSEIILSRGHWAAAARLTQERLMFLLLWSLLPLGERAVKPGPSSAAGGCTLIWVVLI